MQFNNQNSNRNPGIPFSQDLLNSIFEDSKNVEKRIEQLKSAAALNNFKENDLLKIISCVDLTSLAGDDTPEKIDILLKKAVKPLPERDVKVASVCVYQTFVKQACNFLKDTKVGVATVAGGFPAGQMDLAIKIKDIEKSVEFGATEIDAVISRWLPLTGEWEGLYNEVKAFKQSCGSAILKVIMATGELTDYTVIAKTSWVCMMAGADFIKTSTGMEKVNATLEAGYVMMKAIKAFSDLTKAKVGLKPAGGIRTTMAAMQWFFLLQEELGQGWMNNQLFRIGASGLLDDLVLKFD